ncbi:MAG: hypothetical protein KKD30_12400 [Gammaproteobacteria bacterium]|nr:hypothetical protein [Gammaproteobacteria bacterium]MBU0882052.1 hypothetical protein [Gammaproteobacteria bacterium]MBU1860743.1 hypothetical protein [Gammaproteobacteria bacterium]
MAATCLQGSAVLPFNYSYLDDRKTFIYAFSGLFFRAANSAWRTAHAPLKSMVQQAFTPADFF